MRILNVLNTLPMQGDSLIISDTLKTKVDSSYVVDLPVFINNEVALSDTIPFSLPVYVISKPETTFPLVSTDIFHSGTSRKKDILQESVILLLLLVVVFFLFRFFSKGTETALIYFRKLSKTDARNNKTDFSGIRIMPVFWIADMIILTFTSKMYLSYFNKNIVSEMPEIAFLTILLFVISFWLIKNFVSYVIGVVFFSKTQINNWFAMSMLNMTLFSLSLLPLIIVNTAGIALPLIIMVFWPLFFLVLPKMFQYLQAPKLFSLKKRGFLYLILYLCALEILPFLVFIKGLILI